MSAETEHEADEQITCICIRMHAMVDARPHAAGNIRLNRTGVKQRPTQVYVIIKVVLILKKLAK